MPVQPAPWRRRRRTELETMVPVEPEVADFEAADRLGSPEAEVGSAPPAAECSMPPKPARPGHHRQNPQEEAPR